MWSGGLATIKQPAAMGNIVITGFMGTGKTTVGRLVADFTGWCFVDADAEIEVRVGMTIPEIFVQEGEAGFRRYETAVCQSLAARSQLVIATGGGMLIDPENLAVMKSSGLVVCLTATPDVIEQRLLEADNRPLAGNWKELFVQRRSAYSAIAYQIDTSHTPPEAVAQEIVCLWQREANHL